jgi:hypothetical protein
MEQVAADLKIKLVFSIPGKPRGRGRIERFFRTVDEMFLSLDGYLARSRKQPTLTLPLLEEQFRAFLLEICAWNAQTRPTNPQARLLPRAKKIRSMLRIGRRRDKQPHNQRRSGVLKRHPRPPTPK